MPRRPVHVPALAAVLAAALLGACQSGKAPTVTDDPSATPATQAESAAAVKRAMQPLVELGASPQVTMDEPVGCTGDPQGETYAATYTVTMTLDRAARDRLTSQVLPGLQAQGWRLREDDLALAGRHSWSLERGDLRMGLAAGTTAGDDSATVQGSGPCLPKDA